ncbi:MAG: aminodeoxychorismate/anthranilate synthase component II [Thermoleophilia bacterium]|nr:aminodeoxychorismate/anthranilate synthase component II [Thermoleophilia bacterium]
MVTEQERIKLNQSLSVSQDLARFPVPGLSELRILVVDNYDSFTYNLVQYLGEISGAEVRVFRNDRITVKGIREEEPTHIVISPGPCTPDEAGVSLEVVAALAGECPLLGVCLGHQAIGQVFGGQVIRGTAPVHGKTSTIHHDGRTIFAGLPNPFTATRYHSLVVAPELPPVLERSAWTGDGVVMGVRHREFVVEGVQFHPESLLTTVGKDLLCNFLLRREARWTGRETPAEGGAPLQNGGRQ